MSTMRSAVHSGRLEALGFALAALGSDAAAIAFRAAKTLDAMRERHHAQADVEARRLAIRARIRVCLDGEADRPTPRNSGLERTRMALHRVA
jgi:hypothetical protein